MGLVEGSMELIAAALPVSSSSERKRAVYAALESSRSGPLLIASASTLSRSSSEKLSRAAAALEGMNRSLYVIGDRGLLHTREG